MNRLLHAELILLCFLMGFLLVLAPWSSPWEQNYFLDRYPALVPILLHPAVRGLVTGLGLLDVILAASLIRRRPAATAVAPPS
jgi:hypothetical protein